MYHEFRNFGTFLKAPLVIYADFKFVLVSSTDNSYNGSNTEKYQDHIIFSYGYKLICADKQYSKPYKSYFGEDAINKFLYDMMNECEYCHRVIEREINKPLDMRKED